MLTFKEENRVKRLFCEAECHYLANGNASGLAELPAILDTQPDTERYKRRLLELKLLFESGKRPVADLEYVRHWGFGGVRVFESQHGRIIYQIAIRSFPGHDTHCYYLPGQEPVLIDIGSGLPSNESDWRERHAVMSQVFGIHESFRSLRHLVISHGHVDHYGYLPKLLQNARPTIYCHELDARVLEQFDERIVMAGRDLGRYMRLAGIDTKQTKLLVDLFSSGRDYFRNCAVDVRLRDGSVIPGGGQVIHVPGHCAGLICIRFDDLLFTADHLLQDVTPHQSPQFLNPFFGLENYFTSLHKIAELSGLRVGLPSHGPLIHDIRGRIQEILYFHQRRLGQVLDLCEKPMTVADVARELFGDLKAYNVILGIEEAGAHVEYLQQHGWLRVANLDDIHSGSSETVLYVQDSEAAKRRKEPGVRARGAG